ncbi:AAEL011845-PA [Aedes aegypti]|uniref:AAEL011845-PA n=1 Tax=Aedes aegypti TaxID=7159 RepID=Q16NV6_AEDAE|nr:AAEL011845-PA [Aedes aegypti]
MTNPRTTGNILVDKQLPTVIRRLFFSYLSACLLKAPISIALQKKPLWWESIVFV